MPAPFTKALQVSLGTLQSVAGDRVAYRRADLVTYVTAVPAKTNVEVTSNLGELNVSAAMDVRDFLVEAEQLAFSGSPILPQEGDKIEYNGQTFRVSVLGDEVYRFQDPENKFLRIHTVLQDG